LLGVVLGLAQHPGPAQQFDGVDGRRLSERLIELVQAGQQPVERGLIDVEGHGVRLRRSLLQRAVDLAALEIARQRLSQLCFLRAAAVRQTQRRIEVAVIDATNLAYERAKRAGALMPRETRHAGDHWSLDGV